MAVNYVTDYRGYQILLALTPELHVRATVRMQEDERWPEVWTDLVKEVPPARIHGGPNRAPAAVAKHALSKCKLWIDRKLEFQRVFDTELNVS